MRVIFCASWNLSEKESFWFKCESLTISRICLKYFNEWLEK
jgi:hypothetical protein